MIVVGSIMSEQPGRLRIDIAEDLGSVSCRREAESVASFM